ncbi:Metallo-dependent hydrolase [Schizopora paradoxa]|uniref:Metallo-dependent hydrolase n=1 Tax=Schizopora paradoxa TaxID=27342 RepID=A0A0H2RJY7_9AGAM|nr:Metallo-dependent hydrolase [Schizopora paradoxa]
MLISNVHLPYLDEDNAGHLYSIRCTDGFIESVERQPQNHPVANNEDVDLIDGKGGLLLPSLCHSHIHLDKCYILEQGEPLTTGDFAEALRVTSAVKAGFVERTDDLYARGRRLIQESVASGVTSMRAHVEVDAIVGSACLEVGLRLSEEFKDVCDVEIAVFMQDPIFDSERDIDFGKNASVLKDVLDRYASSSKAFTAVGSAPYVERTREQQLKNIEFIISLAQNYDLHLDFHLDYDLKPCDEATEQASEDDPLIFAVLSYLAQPSSAKVKSLTVGHMTRLSVFTPPLISRLRSYLEAIPPESSLRSISFVGLPQSDLYMMGRRSSSSSSTSERYEESFGGPSTPRGTLDVLRFRRFCDSVNEKLRGEHARSIFVNVAMSVNNVANAFTPQGTADPLSLCTLGVAVYQSATKESCRVLLESISTASKLAVGDVHSSVLADPLSILPTSGRPADFVILHDNSDIQSAVLSPSYSRTTIKGGRVVSWRVGVVHM